MTAYLKPAYLENNIFPFIIHISQLLGLERDAHTTKPLNVCIGSCFSVWAHARGCVVCWPWVFSSRKGFDPLQVVWRRFTQSVRMEQVDTSLLERLHSFCAAPRVVSVWVCFKGGGYKRHMLLLLPHVPLGLSDQISNTIYLSSLSPPASPSLSLSAALKHNMPLYIPPPLFSHCFQFKSNPSISHCISLPDYLQLGQYESNHV